MIGLLSLQYQMFTITIFMPLESKQCNIGSTVKAGRKLKIQQGNPNLDILSLAGLVNGKQHSIFIIISSIGGCVVSSSFQFIFKQPGAVDVCVVHL